MEFLILFSPQLILSVAVWRCAGNCMNAVKGEGGLVTRRGRRGRHTDHFILNTNLTKSNHSLDDEASNKVARMSHWPHRLCTRTSRRLASRTEEALEAPATAPPPPDMMTTGGLMVPLSPSSVRMMSW